jgi:UDP-glucose 4-epimerase
MTILVTGGAGYIGSHMVKMLRSQGKECLVLDDFSSGYEKSLLGADFIKADIADKNTLDEIFLNRNITSVIHFASKISVAESVENPGAYYDNNVGKTIVLLRKMADYGINKIVFSSTAAIFGNPDQATINELTRVAPINPYGRSKAMVEEILQDFEASNSLRSVCLRYFNAAGADPDGQIGERHNPETHLIPLLLQVAAGRREKIVINGTDYPTDDGTCIRDYIHVEDLCQAHLLALNHLEKNGTSKKYNLGNGMGYSIREIIEATLKVSGKEIEIIYGPRRTGDPPKLISDSSLIKLELGWKPKRQNIETIVADAWSWEQKWPWKQ